MIGASLYIIGCTARNRFRVRLRRLREPRYLIGAVVGALYLYFAFFSRLGSPQPRRRRPRRQPSVDMTTVAAVAPTLTGMLLMVLSALIWLLPFEAGLLEFSAAETQFLFTAPVSRRWLLIHRLLRSQLGILFSAVIVGVSAQTLSGPTRLRVGMAMWLIFCTGKVYATGVALVRARREAGGSRGDAAAWLLPAFLSAVGVVVTGVMLQSLLSRPIAGFGDLVLRLGSLADSTAVQIVLWPFVALARPLFAAWPWPFLQAFAVAAVVLALTIGWTLMNDEALGEAAEKAAARKHRRTVERNAAYSVRSPGWSLAPIGRPELAIAWKAAMQTSRMIDRRFFIRVIAVLGVMVMIAAMLGRRNGLAAAIGAFALFASAFAVVLGPQIARIDMRQDLQHLELLKTWPVQPGAVIRGQLIWPAALITAAAWAAMAVATLFSATHSPGIPLATRIAAGVAAIVLAPALTLAQLVIHNGAALIFPAWVPQGNQRARGVDAMGQRIIMLGGSWLALLVMALPGVLLGGIVFLVLRLFVGWLAIVPAAGAIAMVLVVEVLAVTEMLAPVYEKLDILAVERPE